MNEDVTVCQTTIKGGLPIIAKGIVEEGDHREFWVSNVTFYWPHCECPQLNCRHLIRFPVPYADERRAQDKLLATI